MSNRAARPQTARPLVMFRPPLCHTPGSASSHLELNLMCGVFRCSLSETKKLTTGWQNSFTWDQNQDQDQDLVQGFSSFWSRSRVFPLTSVRLFHFLRCVQWHISVSEFTSLPECTVTLTGGAVNYGISRTWRKHWLCLPESGPTCLKEAESDTGLTCLRCCCVCVGFTFYFLLLYNRSKPDQVRKKENQ